MSKSSVNITLSGQPTSGWRRVEIDKRKPVEMGSLEEERASSYRP